MQGAAPSPSASPNIDTTMETRPLSLSRPPSTSFRRTKPHNIVQEIRDMENAYIHRLSILVDHFFKPVLAKEIVSKSRALELFGNIEDVRNLHSELLIDLEKTLEAVNKEREMIEDGGDDVHISRLAGTGMGTTFNSFAPRLFPVYEEYVRNYQHSSEVLEQLLERSTAFRRFVDDSLEKLRNMTPPPGVYHLPSFFILPVQHLPRYRLLLEDLIKNSDDVNITGGELSRAIDQIKELVAKVNDGIAKGPTPPTSRPGSAASSVSSLSSSSSKGSMASSVSSSSLSSPIELPSTLDAFTTPPRRLSMLDRLPSSMPSYLRPTHTSYHRANEGRSKRDQVGYTSSSTPLWKPSGNPHSDKIYNTAYNTLEHSSRPHSFVDRPNAPLWRPPSSPKSFSEHSATSPSSSPSRAQSALGIVSPSSTSSQLHPGRRSLSDTFVVASQRRLDAVASPMSSRSAPEKGLGHRQSLSSTTPSSVGPATPRGPTTVHTPSSKRTLASKAATTPASTPPSSSKSTRSNSLTTTSSSSKPSKMSAKPLPTPFTPSPATTNGNSNLDDTAGSTPPPPISAPSAHPSLEAPSTPAHHPTTPPVFSSTPLTPNVTSATHIPFALPPTLDIEQTTPQKP
eukprot:TRINITY_DN4657_c0_g1_i3.p1 TRINITY_DN4657_c0_g1~~TRINITY_DN4657_c0_g1_i3.p1  ORF type:complete len:624 (-),score=131.46 TRINITY_DN4657_c0_g1_i3:36-1907(-)